MTPLPPKARAITTAPHHSMPIPAGEFAAYQASAAKKAKASAAVRAPRGERRSTIQNARQPMSAPSSIQLIQAGAKPR